MWSLLAASAAEHPAAGDHVVPGPLGAWVDVAVVVGIVVIVGAMLLCVYRLIRGPHLADRALAVDTLAIMLIGLVILLTILFRTRWFIDGVLVLSLLGFAGTVAMAQYIARPHLRGRAGPEAPPAADTDET